MVKHKKTHIFLMIIGSIIVFSWIISTKVINPYSSAYNSSSQHNCFENDFIKYLGGKREISTGNSDVSFCVCSLCKDRVVNNHTNMVLTVNVFNPQNNTDSGIQEGWMAYSGGSKRDYMRACAFELEGFLEHKKVNYDYNIYIVVDGDNQKLIGNYVYDEHNEQLWVSNYEQDVATNIIDPDSNKKGYKVCIINGRFKEINKEYSTPY